MRKDKYRLTLISCFTAYIVQAITINFVPLLFVTFSEEYGIELSKITFIITLCFILQLGVDLASVLFIDRIKTKTLAVAADVFSAAGLIALGLLPDAVTDKYPAIIVAVVLYSLGSGLLEVIISPLVEACPTDNKEAAMSLLHSFYSWGQAGVVLLSSVFFALFGLSNRRLLSVIWAIVPAVNAFMFIKAPVPALIKDGEKKTPVGELFKNRMFILMLIMMLCAGASEQGVSQWASAFAQKGLGVSKTVGDLAGPTAFALLMAASRTFYGKKGAKIDLAAFMTGSCVLCVASYLTASLSPLPALSLAGCALCGLSVGIFWPGTLSMAGRSISSGGGSMYALLALAGDLGCAAGPTLAGAVSSASGDNLKTGLLAAIVFPAALLAASVIYKKSERNKNRKVGT